MVCVAFFEQVSCPNLPMAIGVPPQVITFWVFDNADNIINFISVCIIFTIYPFTKCGTSNTLIFNSVNSECNGFCYHLDIVLKCTRPDAKQSIRNVCNLYDLCIGYSCCVAASQFNTRECNIQNFLVCCVNAVSQSNIIVSSHNQLAVGCPCTLCNNIAFSTRSQLCWNSNSISFRVVWTTVLVIICLCVISDICACIPHICGQCRWYHGNGHSANFARTV